MSVQHHEPNHKDDKKVSKQLAPLQPPSPPRWKTLLGFAPFTGSAIYLTWARLLLSGSLSTLNASTATANFGSGSRLLDRFIAANIKFYKAALDPSNPPFFPGDVSSISACAIIPIIEALRSNVPDTTLVKSPLITGLAAQTFGRGAIYPLYWSSFISSGAYRHKPSESIGTSIHQYDAEGAFFASLLGFVIPGLGMSITKSSHWTLAWFIYPLTLTFVQKAYSFLRKLLTPYHPSYIVSQKRAYYFLQATYLLQFIYATALHIKVLGPRVFNLPALKKLLYPTISIPTVGSKTPLSEVAFQVVQWDGIILFVSSVAASLAFARSKTELLKIALFDFAATVACGTGGALAGVWAWREYRLHQERAVYHEVMRGI